MGTFVIWTIVIIVGVLILMVKTAHENNVRLHTVELTGNMQRKKILFISDTHARIISKQMLRSFENSFDAVIIGGDFADRRTADSILHENLLLLTSFGPTFFVWGNNDREKGEAHLLKIFQQHGVNVIANDAVLLFDEGERLWLSAVDDCSAKIDQAFRKINASDKVIFVAHNPHHLHRVREKYFADLMLGGHWHGGQIRFGPFGLYPHGSFHQKDRGATLISNGYGTTLLPLRLFAKPECHVITLYFS